MAELLKNIYTLEFFEDFTDKINQITNDFNKESFISQIYDDKWEQRELKQRMRHISIVFRNHLPDDYNKSVGIILSLVDILKSNENNGEFGYIFLPDFIELYGLDNFNTSVNALEIITQYMSCEFAVRPFILKYPDKMMGQMLKWSNHENEKVRRLASEGCRPRLPWAMALPEFKNRPEPVLLILENLKDDSSEFVRKSVANNLNDISKDHPETIITLVKNWNGVSKNREWITKHASRTLLKQGNLEVMKIFGLGSVDNIEINNFSVITPKVKIGENLIFSFNIDNKNSKPQKIRLEYAVYYQKANGSLSKKVYKISEKDYPANFSTKINRKQSFRLISTRKFHIGLHQVSIIINGKEFDKHDFKLIE